MNVKEVLGAAPRPHYLLPETVETRLHEDGSARLTGKAAFPSLDPSVGDRVDHVNFGHHLFAVWQGVHVLRAQMSEGRPFAKRVEIKGRRVTPPDVPVDMALTVGPRGGRARKFSATFSLDGQTLAIISGEGVVQDQG